MKYRMALALLLASAGASVAQDADTTVIRKAREMAYKGECKQALKMVEPYLAADPPVAKATIVRARCLLYTMHEAAEGMALLETALQREPDQFDLLLFRGDTYNTMKMFDRAEVDLALAVANAPDTTSLIRALNEEAWNLLSMRRYSAVHERCDRVLAMDPNNYHCLNNLSLAAKEEGNGPLAVEMLERMTELDPKKTTAWINLGFTLASMERHEEALEAYARAEELGAADASFLNNRGRSKLGIGDVKGARQDIGRSIKLNARNAYAYRNLAHIELHENNVEEACTALEKALELGFTKLYGNEVTELRKEHCK